MNVVLAGASGYIGQAVLGLLLERGHSVTALVRDQNRFSNNYGDAHHPALSIVQWDLEYPDTLAVDATAVDAVISCIASRSGAPRDAHKVEYLANKVLLEAAQRWRAKRFVLLSAICVQKPKLAFQQEKLRFERLLKSSGLTFTIIRPTAFFKSLSGQVERVQNGKPVLIFGDGRLTACKPISERDLAAFIIDTLFEPTAANAELPIGGPGPAITPIEQAGLLCRTFDRPVRTRSVNPKLFDILGALLVPFTPFFKWAQDRSEFMRIAKYYATESMLFWDDAAGAYSDEKTPETGEDSLGGHYANIAAGRSDTGVADEHKLFS